MVCLRLLFVSLLIAFVFPFSSFANTPDVDSSELQVDKATDATEEGILSLLEGEERQQSSNYSLPYPGMLPTNPLYFLKDLRDTFIGFIISDPLKKSEFELLQADKKLASAQFLLKEDQENLQMALQSVEERSRHLQTAYDKLIHTEVKSVDSQAIFQKLAASLGKHQDVLNELSQTTGNDAFMTHAQSASELQKKVESYL